MAKQEPQAANCAERRYVRVLLGVLLGVLAAVAVFNVVIDPFERARLVPLDLPRRQVASVVDTQVQKILAFRHAPRPAIILGDSRGEALRDEYFAEAGRADIFNFACGAGTLYEAVDLFRLADETTRLRQVVVVVSFATYNEENRLDRVPTARHVSSSLPAYYLSPLVTKASALVVAGAVTGRAMVSEAPPMSREEFWRYQLGPGAELHCRRWSRPVVLRSKLEEMARRCRERGIDLVFVLAPQHDDMRALLDEAGLADDYEACKLDLARMGRVLDYDVPGPLTADRANFDDPQHFNREVARDLAHRLAADLGTPPAAAD